MAIEPIIDFEIAELVRFYGSIVGTEGISKDIQDQCNINILRLIDTLQPKLDKLTASKAGLITK